jgi:hypothetical protein
LLKGYNANLWRRAKWHLVLHAAPTLFAVHSCSKLGWTNLPTSGILRPLKLARLIQEGSIG